MKSNTRIPWSGKVSSLEPELECFLQIRLPKNCLASRSIMLRLEGWYGIRCTAFTSTVHVYVVIVHCLFTIASRLGRRFTFKLLPSDKEEF